MVRGWAVAAVVVLGLAACGGSSDGASDDSSSAAATSEFFVEADTDALNASLEAYNEVFAAATDNTQLEPCSTAATYEEQSACLIPVLQPVSDELAALSEAMSQAGARQSLNEQCVTAIGVAVGDIDGYRAEVDSLISDLQMTDDQAVYDAAAQQYSATLNDGNDALNEALVSVTQPCYSAEDLASAAPSPTQ